MGVIVGLTSAGCSDDTPPEIPESDTAPIISASRQTASAEPVIAPVSSFSGQNKGAAVGGKDELAKLKECIDSSQRYDRITAECDATQVPIHTFAWTVEGIISGLRLSGVSANDFREKFADGRDFSGYLVDQVTRGPEGNIWVWVVKDNDTILTINHVKISF